MRFSESKRRFSWVLILMGIIIGSVLVLGFYGTNPPQKTVQKTIVFEAD